MDESFVILIVDDNKNNLFTLHTLINEHIPRVNIVEADSGEHALEVLVEAEVDLVILDVQMPNMDGFETAEFIRNWKRTQHIPIVFLTAAYKSEEFQQKGFTVGAADYLTKPIDAPQLISRIKTYLRFIEQERRHHRELEDKVRERTLELQQAREQLELRVEQRTTELSQATHQLEQLNHRHRSILEAAGEGICGVDTEGRTRFVNPAAAQMLGYQEHELIGQRQHDFIHHSRPDGSPLPAQECAVCQALGDHRSRRVELEVFWRKDGTSFPVACIISPIVENQQIVGIVMTFSDITLRRQAEDALRRAKEEAEQANLAKSRFLANMSHELRTPLNAIIGYSEIITEGARDDVATATDLEAVKNLVCGDFVGDLERIHDAGKHLLGLINDVLDISKIEAGKMQVYNETFRVREMLDDVMSMTQALAKQKHNELCGEYAHDLGMLYSDLTRTRQILFNLLSNACKFTENGKIVLSAEARVFNQVPGYVFQVRDNGVGIPADKVESLFEAFTQADISTTRKYGGTGLGLTLTKRFAEMLGGNVAVESDPGQGSVFSVFLPAEPAQALPAGRAPSVLSRPPLAHNSRILVIDSDPMARAMMRRQVETLGHQALVAASGAEGLEMARRLRPDAITLDIRMEGMDGWEVLAALKQDPALADTPVVVHSLLEDDRSKGYSLGVAEYLVKPCSREQLAVALRKYRPRTADAARILVVEDNLPMREVMAQLLKLNGWQVDVAANGRAALDKMAERLPELVLLDLWMPEMDGFEFLSRLRENPVYAAIPVVVLTAKDLTAQDRVLLEGVKGVFQKGAYKQEILMEELTKLLELLPAGDNASIT